MRDAALRPGTRGDLPALTELYNYYVLHTAITFDIEPFTVASREAWFSRFAEPGPYRLVVAEAEGELLGYACSHPWRPKAAYETSVETSVYCAHGASGRGLGTQLYAALFAALAGLDIHRAYAGITLPNAASERLHARYGFERLAVFSEVGRKQGRYWDVLWLEKKL
jgi:phosphinothricin acetyltransferase